MAKKKTTYSGIILILTAIGIVLGLIKTGLIFINIKLLLAPTLISNSVTNIINFVFSIIGLVILTIFFFKLYNVTPDLIKWTNITYGFSVFNMLLGVILSIIVGGLLGAILSGIGIIFFLPIFIIIWITFVLHLKKAQKEKLMDFS
jgi:hypothetical protein